MATNYLTSFKLSDTPSEHTPSAIACYKAVVKGLPTSGIPPNVLDYFLVGMSHCSSDNFKEVVSVHHGFLYSPIFKDWARLHPDVHSQLEYIGSALEEKHAALATLGVQSAAHKKPVSFLPCLLLALPALSILTLRIGLIIRSSRSAMVPILLGLTKILLLVITVTFVLLLTLLRSV